MDILNMVFTGLFTVEMLLKLLALRLRVRKTNTPPITSHPPEAGSDPPDIREPIRSHAALRLQPRHTKMV